MITNQYDSQGHVNQQTLADNTTIQFMYTEDANGNIVQNQVTDGRGTQQLLSFAPSGYFTGGQLLTDVRAVGKPEQQTFTYAWQPASGLLQSITDPLNRTTSYTYDNNGNLTSTTWLSGTSNAITSSATYEPTFNQVSSTTDPMNRTALYSYDTQGNLIKVTTPMNVVVNQTFNSSGQLLTQITGPAGPVTFEYWAGLLSSVKDALGDQNLRSVDVIGRTVAINDPLGGTTQVGYDAGNRPIQITDPLGGQTQLSYDGDSNLLSLTDARGGVTTFTYDSINRRSGRTDPLQAVERMTYDANGNLLTSTDRKGQITQFTYDALNRIASIKYADNSTIAFTYDAGNRLTQVVDSISGTISRTYDGLDRTLSETSPMGTVSYTYNNAGQRTSMTVAGQPTSTYSYDGDGRISQISQGTAVVRVTYDAAGRRAGLTLPNQVNVSYTYDAASRLTAINYAQGSSLIGDLTYAYDPAGHRTAVGGTLANTALPQPLTSARYNAANQLVQWNNATLTYDANGNLVNDGTLAYGWNARNQLTTLSGQNLSAAFQYDVLGRRQAKSINSAQTNFLYDGPNSVQEQGVDGSIVANMLMGLRADESYLRNEASGSQTFLTDGAHSTLALIDGGGNLTSHYTYDPFGNTTATGPSANTVQYAGRENDGTGLYYYRTRYYSPRLQRFVSEDPIRFASGQTNLYTYVGNSPINYSDPSGQSAGALALGLGEMIPGVDVVVTIGVGIGLGILAWQTMDAITSPTGFMPAPAIPYPKQQRGGRGGGGAGSEGGGGHSSGDGTIQTGGNTVRDSAAKQLNKFFSEDLTRRDWGRALEALKEDAGLADDFHGRLTANGNYYDQNTGELLGNIAEYLP